MVDYGGPLAIEKSTISNPGHVVGKKLWGPNQYQHYDGLFAPSSSYLADMQKMALGQPLAIPAAIGTSVAELKGLGATAIAKSIPDVPDFSLARFVGELREGLPKIPLSQLRKSERKVSALGGEYLNVQFGLLPTLSDVSKLVTLASNPDLRKRVKHHVGEEHRVRKTLKKDSSTSSRALASNEMNTLPLAFAQLPVGTETTTDTVRIWSSVSFQWYQANRLDSLLRDLDEQLGNYGSIPNLIDAWNLTAWSWLVDWFVNFNHVLTNLSFLGRDGLTLQRGYLMCTHERKVETFQSVMFNGTRATSLGTRTFVRKYRVTASPFGFGYKWDGFSPFQTSILASLGVSRLKF